jgi:hypothetical protein
VLVPLEDEPVPDELPEPFDPDEVELPLPEPEPDELPVPDPELEPELDPENEPDPEPEEPPLDDAAPEDPLPPVGMVVALPLHPALAPPYAHAHPMHTARAEPRIPILLPRKPNNDGPERTSRSRSVGVSISFCRRAVFRWPHHTWRMELALLTLVAVCWAVLGAGATSSFALWIGRPGRSPELESSWERYAWSKRFRFLPATGQWPHARAPRIEARVDDIDMVIEACTMTIRGASRPCTRVWALAPAFRPARVAVSSDPRLLQGPWVHELEAVRLGDEFFDRDLSVRSSSGDAAVRLLPPPLRRSLMGLLSSTVGLAVVLKVEEGEVSLIWLGEETRPAMLDEACAVVVDACRATAGSAAYR